MANVLPINLILLLLFIISIIAIIVFIQVKLSRSENKFLGLIMPVISFLISLLIIFNIAAFTVMTSSSTTSEIITTNGTDELIETVEITENLDENLITSGVAISMLFIFLVSNIPTVILGGIYLGERNKIHL